MSFDTLAPHYRWMEWVLAGNKLQRCRTAFLDRVDEPNGILTVGEGNGRFLLACRRRFPRARIAVVDESARMLAMARRRARRAVDLAGVEFVQADASVWQAQEQRFDLIVTHFFLDCFPPEKLRRVIANLSHAASAHAVWLVADFQVPAHGWRRARARAIHMAMYAFFRCATQLPARGWTRPDEFLAKQDFVLCERRTSEWGLLHSDLWQRHNTEPV
jgi:ubiquinone/menaquinone biosynthesis C-methylase UbiE